MDDRDRGMRERDWRRSERYGRSGGRGEGRSWADDDDSGAYGPVGGDRVFGERESGANYGGPRYGRFEGGYGGRVYGGRGRDAEAAAWQGRDYGGVSPAMAHDEYELERRAERRGAGRAHGGRYYGDDGRDAIYRQEYGQGGVEYGRQPRGYDAGRDEDIRRDHRRGNFAEDYEYSVFSPGGDQSRAGYEGGPYPDVGPRDLSRGRYYYDDERKGLERGARDAGQFFRRAGERVAAWFGAEGGERGRGMRGMGPKDYQRPDERISEDAHERLTDDAWVDASNISISVSGAEVTLSGTVENREAKHRAERIVEDVSGVKHVQNNLRVDQGSYFTSPSRGYGDSVLAQQMREARTEGGDGASDESRPGRGKGAGLSS
jgi:osmotically-inducible protein OsmY